MHKQRIARRRVWQDEGKQGERSQREGHLLTTRRSRESTDCELKGLFQHLL